MPDSVLETRIKGLEHQLGMYKQALETREAELKHLKAESFEQGYEEILSYREQAKILIGKTPFLFFATFFFLAMGFTFYNEVWITWGLISLLLWTVICHSPLAQRRLQALAREKQKKAGSVVLSNA